MKTIAEIAKEAFDGVSAEIGDAIVTATIGAVTGRAVFEREKSPKGMPTPSDDARLQSVWLEGFTDAPEYADTMTSGGVDFFVMGVNNLMQSGGFYNVMAIGVDELLNTSIIVKRASRVSDGAGGYDETWASHATVNGGVTNIGGSEGWNYGRVTSDASVRVILEYTADLTVKDALLFDGKYHNISYIDNSQNRGKWLVVDCMEGVAQRASEPETAPTAPVNTLAPSITPASANDGDILTLDEGLWTGSPTPTLTAQWLRNGTAISGATGLTLDTTGYGGDRISAYVLGSNSLGSSVAVSSNAVDVAAGAPTGATITGYTSSYIIRDRTFFEFASSGVMGISGADITDVEFDLIGGGGGSFFMQFDFAPGAGPGEFVERTAQALTIGSYPVVIGAGGICSTNATADGGTGGSSTFNGLTAIGGGSPKKSGYTGTDMDGGSGAGQGGTGGTPDIQGLSIASDGIGNNGGALQSGRYGGGGGAGSAGGNVAPYRVWTNNGNLGTDNARDGGDAVLALDGTAVCGGGGAWGGGAGGVYAEQQSGGNGGLLSSDNGQDALTWGGGGGGGGRSLEGATTNGNGYQGVLILSVPTSQLAGA